MKFLKKLFKLIVIVVIVIIVLGLIRRMTNKKEKDESREEYSITKEEQSMLDELRKEAAKEESSKEESSKEESSKESEPEEEPESEPEPEEEPETEPEPEEEPEEEAPASGIRPEIKEAIDAYEAFVDEYCEFMETVSEDPTNAELLAAYIEYVDKLEEEERKMDALDKDLTEEEEDYYIEVLDRCNKKIMETAVELDA